MKKYSCGGFLVVVAVVFIKTAACIRGRVFNDFGMNICKGYNRGRLVFEGGVRSRKYGIGLCTNH